MKLGFAEGCCSKEIASETPRRTKKKTMLCWSGIRDVVTFLLFATSMTALVFVLTLSKRIHEIENNFENELIQSRLSVVKLGNEYEKLTSLLAQIDETVKRDETGRLIFDPELIKSSMRIRRSTENCMCPPGQKGEKGSPGFGGQRGEKGQRGDMGLPGIPGRKGEPGLITNPAGVLVNRQNQAGPPGPPGLNGAKGEPGVPGQTGEKGERGDRGYKGEKGQKGYITTYGGNTRLRTYWGQQRRPQSMVRIGIPGDRGPPGPPGEPGKPGIGFVGQKGEPGAAGQKGDTGVAGTPGLDGVDGLKGSEGSKGEKGECQEASMDSQDYNTGGVWNVTCSCITDHKGSLTDILVPGPPGPKGPLGLQGPPGQRGLDGPRGEKGEKGHRGSPGHRGLRGKRGVKGKTGKRGFKGAPGIPGAPGLDAALCRMTDDGVPVDPACYQYKTSNHRRRKRGGYKGSLNILPTFRDGDEFGTFP